GDQEAAGRLEDDRPGDARTGKDRLGPLPQRLRSGVHAAARGPRRAQGGLGAEPGREGWALRASRAARAMDRPVQQSRRTAAAADESRTKTEDSGLKTDDQRLTTAEPPADLVARVRTLRGKWQQELALRGVHHERAAALDQRYAAAFARVIAAWPAAFEGTDL